MHFVFYHDWKNSDILTQVMTSPHIPVHDLNLLLGLCCQDLLFILSSSVIFPTHSPHLTCFIPTSTEATRPQWGKCKSLSSCKPRKCKSLSSWKPQSPHLTSSLGSWKLTLSDDVYQNQCCHRQIDINKS